MATKCVVNKSTMTGIADAIRAKGGTSDTLLPSDMPAAIAALPSGGGGWQRPSDWPRIDQLPRDNAVVYALYDLEGVVSGARDMFGKAEICANASSGKVRIERGTVAEGEFVTDSDGVFEINSGSVFTDLLPTGRRFSAYRVTAATDGEEVTAFGFDNSLMSQISTNAARKAKTKYPCVEIIANIPHMVALHPLPSIMVKHVIWSGALSGMTDLSYMFNRVRSVESFDLSGFNTSGATTMESLFDSCNSVKELDLSGFDVSDVTSMFRMFEYCNSLESVNFGSWNTSSLTNIGQMFYSCTSLKTLDLSGFDIGSVTSMPNLMNMCQSLVYADLRFSVSPRSACDLSQILRDTSAIRVDLSGVVFPEGSVLNSQDLPNNMSAFAPCQVGSVQIFADFRLWNSNAYTHDAIMETVGALPQLPTGVTHTLTLGSTTLKLLSADEISAANAKGWTLA